MKKIILLLLGIMLFSSIAMAEQNCAREKNQEFKELLEKLEDIDLDLATEARNAYGMVASFETFDDKEPRCTHMDRLLKQMRETISLYK